MHDFSATSINSSSLISLTPISSKHTGSPISKQKSNTCSISSLGAFVSFFGAVMVIFIIWEAIVSKRIVIRVFIGYWDVEWGYEYPLSYHNANEVAKIYI